MPCLKKYRITCYLRNVTCNSIRIKCLHPSGTLKKVFTSHLLHYKCVGEPGHRFELTRS